MGVKLLHQSLPFRLCNGAVFITKATNNLAYYCKVGICRSLRNGCGRDYESSMPTSAASSRWHPILPVSQGSTPMQATDIAHSACALSPQEGWMIGQGEMTT